MAGVGEMEFGFWIALYSKPRVLSGTWNGGDVNGDYLTSNPGSVSIYLAGLNEGRLPAYHRLDVNVKRTWKDVGGGEMELSAGITNVYDRDNVFYINRITGQRKNQLPFLPSVGLDWSF